jgi:hypothetical protein
MVMVTVPLTMGFGWALARMMKLDGRYGVLSGGAVGICGASAAMAIAVAWPRKDSERDTVMVIACITTYSTIAMVLYPALLAHLHLDPLQTGRFLGGSIHDVAQVVAAGYASSPQAGDSATIVKLMRVAMLLPHCLRRVGRTERICSRGKAGRVGPHRSVEMAVGHFGGSSRHEDKLARNDGRRHDRDCPHRRGNDIPGPAGIELDHAVRRHTLIGGHTPLGGIR